MLHLGDGLFTVAGRRDQTNQCLKAERERLNDAFVNLGSAPHRPDQHPNVP